MTACFRIVVVDDYPDAADTLATALSLAGHRVVTAYRGGEVLDAVRAHRPHAVVLDVSLPDVSGLELAQRIRAEFAADRPRLLAVTGWGQPADRLRTAEAGFDGHLTKPVDPDEILAWIERELGVARDAARTRGD